MLTLICLPWVGAACLQGPSLQGRPAPKPRLCEGVPHEKAFAQAFANCGLPGRLRACSGCRSFSLQFVQLKSTKLANRGLCNSQIPCSVIA